ncbi:MAG: AI-2E family transporter [Bacteroidota bacterium]
MTVAGNTVGGTRPFVIAAALVVIIYGINQAQSVASLVLFSMFLALIGTPAVFWLERKRIPSFIAVFMVMACMIALLFVIGGVVGASINMFSDELPNIQTRLEEQVLLLKPMLENNHITVNEKVLVQYVNAGSIMELVSGFFSALGAALSDIVLILLTVTFVLLEASSFPVKLRSFLGDPKRVFPHFTLFAGDIVRYMVIKTLISLATGIVIGVWLWILGVQYAVLWGFLAFLLNYVPSVGSSIAAVPAVLFALIQLGMGSALLAMGGFMAVNFILDNIIETKLMGNRLGISTLAVFLSLILWGSLLGPIGMVLCIPLTMTVKFACENNKETAWIAVLLESEDSIGSKSITVKQ